MQQIEVYKGRRVILPVSLGIDVSDDTITSEIRAEPSVESDLIAEWDVAFQSDGIDGEIILTLNETITAEINNSTGYMDLKRVSAGAPFNVFDQPLQVVFLDTITE